ncbi:CBBY-like protein [Morus notabilis]|uniref:CBBY-like protein n=1 Tax=Morus notabilis TaxID=981085 RepID=UPI000CED226B|nr:CBBY-like protein [Morus notabilis]
MEFALCPNPMLTALRFSTTARTQFCSVTRNHLSFFPPFSSNFPEKISNFLGKCPHTNPPLTPLCSNYPPDYLGDDETSSQGLGVLLEFEGVLVDAYRLGNRQAFNTAFRKLGLDCASWSEPVYLDLVRKSIGDEERMLILFFNRIGWPTSLPTSEKSSFVKRVLQEKETAFNEFLVSKDLPLRPGVEEFIDDAYNGGVPVVILTAYSRNADKIARSITEKLGHERVSKVKIIGNEEVEQSMYGQLVRNKEFSSGLNEELAKQANEAVSAEKQRIAEEVASKLKLSVNIDTTSSESLGKIIAALRAGAESACLPVYNCVLVAGSQSGVAGAERVGMPCVVLRSSLTSRAQFPSAKAKLDGFGGADLTISKLRQKRWS